MRVYAILFFIMALFVGVANANTVKVNGFNAFPQEMSNWCWAASIQSIFLTSGLTVTQSRIVTAAYGSPVNRTAPGFDGTLKILNGLSISEDGSSWEVSASAINGFPSPNWLLNKLKNNEPVMIWFNDEYENHSIVVNGGRYYLDNNGGVNWQEIFAYDPWYNKVMTIDASNIPRYVYGTFDIKLRTVSNPKMSQVQFGDVCYVQNGACLLSQLLPFRSQCYCPSSFGFVYGYVGN